MGFIQDKVVAPVAGHVAKHTSPAVGHKAVNAIGPDKVKRATQQGSDPSTSREGLYSGWQYFHPA